ANGLVNTKDTFHSWGWRDKLSLLDPGAVDLLEYINSAAIFLKPGMSMLRRSDGDGIAADRHACAKFIWVPGSTIGWIIWQKRSVQTRAVVGDQLGGLDPLAVDAFVYVGCAGIERKPSGGG